MKAVSMAARSKRDKALADRQDLLRLLRAFPELGADVNAVTARLRATGATSITMAGWYEALRHPVQDDDDGE